jgi:hypothetical protein
MSTSSVALHVRFRGHSAHFAHRLHRVQGEHLALAIALAEDSELVREILEQTPPFPYSDRVALALGRGAHTPVIISSRRGKFITCLGRGMRRGPHPFVPRERIEAIAARMVRSRLRLAPIHELAASIDHALSRSLCAIDFAAARMPREHFLEIARWEPFLGPELRAVYAEASATVRALLPAVSALATDGEATVQEVRALESFWDAFFTASNLHALVGDDDVERGLEPIFASSVVQTTARALWAAARAPGSLFDHVASLEARGVQGLTSLPAHLVRDTALTIAALTSSDQCPQALAAFQTRRAAKKRQCEREWSGVRGVLADVIADPERALDTFTEEAQQLVADAIGGDPMAIPAEVARALVVSVGSDWLDEPQWQSVIASAVPWLVGASAAELFIPRDWCAPVHFTPARAIAIVQSMTRMQRLNGTVATPALITESAANQGPAAAESAAA